MTQDRFGLPVNCDSPAAVALYIDGLDLLLSANDGGAERLDAALDLAPDFALAHAAKARLAQMYMQPSKAREHANIARQHAKGEREQGHVEAIALLIEGKGGEALAQVRRHAEAYPRDALPLSLALGVYGLLGFSGRADHHELQRDLLESVAHGWDDDWWFLTYLGWSYAETFAPAKGAPLLDKALELNPRNAHAAHARAHAYYEAGEAATGRDFVAAWLPDYDRASQLHCHLTWHTALFALLLGDTDAALALYDDAVRPDVATSPPLFTLADAASLLWRLMAYGRRVDAATWEPVAALARDAFPHAGIPFADVHAAMATAASGGDVAPRVAEIDALIADGKLAAGPVVPALCRGLAAFAAGEPDRAAEILEPLLDEMARIGGSHAQRDVIEDTLVVAYLRAGNKDRAEAALRRRCAARAGHLDAAWMGRVTV